MVVRGGVLVSYFVVCSTVLHYADMHACIHTYITPELQLFTLVVTISVLPKYSIMSCASVRPRVSLKSGVSGVFFAISATVA